MIKEIVFATRNKNKLQELREIVGDKFKILSLDDIGCKEDIKEDGTTLKENSLIKARYVKDHYGYDCFADDSGLEIDELNGAPGVYSARFAGDDCNSENNIDKVLILMGDCFNRKAKFVTVFTLILNNKISFFEGEIKGSILKERRGNNGFGYDSVFMPDGFDKSFAEMEHDEKNSISHRGIATKKLVEYLNKTSV